MANEHIVLKAKANQLGIEGFRTLSLEDLKAAIARAEGTGSAPAKGKGKTASANGATAAPAKGKTSTTPAKGKAKGKGKTKTTASKSAPAKSTTRKSTSAKTTAAKGTAKRQTAAAAKGRGKASSAKAKTGSATKTQTAKPKTRARNAPARVDIDRKSVDWRMESNVGRPGSGKRETVMDALRHRKGNYDKVFEDLVGYAVRWYPDALNSYPTAPTKKHAAERMLRWLINRVALDFVKATGQHKSGVRAGYGESDKPQDIRRRELRAERAAEVAKAERAAKRAKGKSKK